MKGKYYSRAIKVMIFIIDFWLINLAFLLTWSIGWAYTLSYDKFTSFFLTFGLIWIIAGFLTKIYRIDTTSLLRNICINLFSTFLIHIVIITAILSAFHIYSVDTKFLICIYFLSSVFIIGFRVLYKLILKYFQFTGFDKRKVVIIGATGSGIALFEHFKQNESAGYRFEGFFDNTPPDDLKKEVIGSLEPDTIKSFCIKEDIGEIYFAMPLTYKELLRDISAFADNNFIYFRMAPSFSETNHDNGNVFLINSVPVLTTRKEPLYISFNANLKRVFDIIFSTLVIVL